MGYDTHGTTLQPGDRRFAALARSQNLYSDFSVQRTFDIVRYKKRVRYIEGFHKFLACKFIQIFFNKNIK